MSTDEIDALLQRYLYLLDQYTALRTELSTLQASIRQDIARANFSSDRGIRYGQDYYDSRMRASRLVQLRPVEKEEISFPTFTIRTAASDAAQEQETPSAETSASKNPLNMFGILVPQPLRSAQKSAIVLVENVVPQLTSIDAEMRELEIRIRRARKYHKREQIQRSENSVGAPVTTATRDGPPWLEGSTNRLEPSHVED